MIFLFIYIKYAQNMQFANIVDKFFSNCLITSMLSLGYAFEKEVIQRGRKNIRYYVKDYEKALYSIIE